MLSRGRSFVLLVSASRKDARRRPNGTCVPMASPAQHTNTRRQAGRQRNTRTHARTQVGRHAADVGRCSRHDLPSFRPVRSCVRRRTKRSRGSSGRSVGRSVTRPTSQRQVCVCDRPDRPTDRPIDRRRRRRRRRPDDWRLHQQQQSNSGISTKLQLGPLWPARPLARSLARWPVRSFVHCVTHSLTYSLTHCQRTPQKIALPAKGDVSADYPLNEWINDCISAGRPD